MCYIYHKYIEIINYKIYKLYIYTYKYIYIILDDNLLRGCIRRRRMPKRYAKYLFISSLPSSMSYQNGK